MGLFSLAGKVAVVTGSSRGIGLAIAQALAEAGAKVVISSRNQDACEAVAAEINAAHGPRRGVAIAATLSSKDSLQALVDGAREALGPIDILVCNAASNPYYGPMTEIGDDQFRKILENNVMANHWLITMVAPEMMRRSGGSVVVISSIGGLLGSNVLGAYNISKAADLQLVRNFAAELGPHNVRVNAIAPGVIRTKFARALWEDPVSEAALNARTPLGRIGEPSDIGGVAAFLASPAGAYITGQTIVVDGGSTISTATYP